MQSVRVSHKKHARSSEDVITFLEIGPSNTLILAAVNRVYWINTEIVNSVTENLLKVEEYAFPV